MPFFLSSISHLLLFINFLKQIGAIQKTLNFGHKKAFLGKFKILSRFYINVADFTQFLYNSFFHTFLNFKNSYFCTAIFW